MYHNFYESLHNFNKSEYSNKTTTNDFKHISYTTDINQVNSDGSDLDIIDLMKKNSAAKNKINAKRTQQVWVLQNPNWLAFMIAGQLDE